MNKHLSFTSIWTVPHSDEELEDLRKTYLMLSSDLDKIVHSASFKHVKSRFPNKPLPLSDARPNTPVDDKPMSSLTEDATYDGT